MNEQSLTSDFTRANWEKLTEDERFQQAYWMNNILNGYTQLRKIKQTHQENNYANEIPLFGLFCDVMVRGYIRLNDLCVAIFVSRDKAEERAASLAGRSLTWEPTFPGDGDAIEFQETHVELDVNDGLSGEDIKIISFSIFPFRISDHIIGWNKR